MIVRKSGKQREIFKQIHENNEMRNASLQQQQKQNNNILYALAAPVFDLPRHLSFPPFLSTAARLAIILNLGSHFAPCARLIIKKLRILIRYMCHINKQHTHPHTHRDMHVQLHVYMFISICIAVKPHGCSLAAAF